MLSRYKELKKHLKNIKKQQDAAAQQGGQHEQPVAAVEVAALHQQQQGLQQQQQGLQEYSEDELGYQMGPVSAGRHRASSIHCTIWHSGPTPYTQFGP